MKKKRTKLIARSSDDSSRIKASEMILQVAGGLIAMAQDIQEKQNCLNLACTAWNLSLLPPDKRNEAIRQCITQYRKMNPEVTDSDCESLQHNYTVIIEERLRIFPSSQKHMLSASVEEVQGKHRFNVVSYDPERQ